jgi:hypothetical protein
MGEITEIKDEIKQDIDSKVDQNASISQQLYQYSQTPYPAWVFSSLLLSTPFVLKQPLSTIQTGTSGGSFRSLFKGATGRIGPSPASSLLFGGAFALGGWIIRDGDVESGTGFITAWSTLYLIVNAKSSFKGLRYGKVWPILLSTVAGANAYTHGKRFFFTSAK